MLTVYLIAIMEKLCEPPNREVRPWRELHINSNSAGLIFRTSIVSHGMQCFPHTYIKYLDIYLSRDVFRVGLGLYFNRQILFKLNT